MSRFMLNDESLGIVPMYNSDFQVCRVIIRTKKEHSCAHCEQQIAAGSPCYYFVGVSGFQFYYYHAHVDCA